MNTHRSDPPTPQNPGFPKSFRGRAFLDRQARVPVAGEPEWTAFPVALQQTLNALGIASSERLGDRPETESATGVLLHAPTRSGKTTLVGQVLRRIPGARCAIFSRPLAPMALFEQVVEALDLSEAEHRLQGYRQAPLATDELEEQLIQWLDEHTSEERPLVLVADGFNAWLRANDSSPKRLRTRCAEPATLLFRVTARTKGFVRLIVTSRDLFTLPDRGRDLTDLLTLIELGPPDPEVLDRLVVSAFSELSSSDTSAIDDAGPDTPGLSKDASLQTRIRRASLGHLGLVDLLTRSAIAVPEALESALGTIEAYLDSRGEVPKDELPEVTAFFESLTYERLLQGLHISERDLLRLSTSFEAPAPLSIVKEFARRFSLLESEEHSETHLVHSRLATLGLWDFLEPESKDRARDTDRAKAGGTEDDKASLLHLVLNPVARPRAGSLDDEERPAVAMHLIQLYVDTWLPEPASVANPIRSLQLSRLAVACGDPEILNRVVPAALEVLQGNLEDEAALHLGTKALQLLDNSRFEAGSELLTALARLHLKVGETQQAAGLLARAEPLEDRDPLQQARFACSFAAAMGSTGNLAKAAELAQSAITWLDSADKAWELAAALALLSDIQTAREEPAAALSSRQAELEILVELGEHRRAVTALGHLAHLHVSGDQIEQAIEAHESALELARRLKNDHLVASIQGELARTLAEQPGSGAPGLDRAGALHQERLEYFSSVGDGAGRAHALWSKARIELQHQRIDAAMALLVEAYHLNLELDRPDGIGLVGLDYGQVLWAAGMMGEARLILERAVQAFRRLGDARLLAQAEGILEELTSAS